MSAGWVEEGSPRVFSAALNLESSLCNMGLEGIRNAGRPLTSSELTVFLAWEGRERGSHVFLAAPT